MHERRVVGNDLGAECPSWSVESLVGIALSKLETDNSSLGYANFHIKKRFSTYPFYINKD